MLGNKTPEQMRMEHQTRTEKQSFINEAVVNAGLDSDKFFQYLQAIRSNMRFNI
jgi:hypothetical protein